MREGVVVAELLELLADVLERAEMTLAADDARGMVVFLLAQLRDLVQLLCARQEGLAADCGLKRFGGHQRLPRAADWLQCFWPVDKRLLVQLERRYGAQSGQAGQCEVL